MPESIENNQVVIWREPAAAWGLLFISLGILGYIYFDALAFMVKIWTGKEEYSHGFLIPVIALFFIWQKKDELELTAFTGSWMGLLLLLLGLALYFLGELSTLYIIIQYGFLLAFYGLALAWLGWHGFKKIWIPLILLVFMIPLPLFLYQGLSAKLQLVSTELGVWVIRLFDIAVYVEGNVIDLGTFKLQVVEACSGLRYLFPLMALGVIAGYLYQGAVWKRLFIFLSTLPITILMNSFRIGAIGVMVEYWGQSMAEGFLHDFEGWVIFMACTAILILEMWLLTRVGEERRPLREVFGLEFPAPSPTGALIKKRRIPLSFLVSTVALMVAVLLSLTVQQRSEVVPQRLSFAEFPVDLGQWHGNSERLEQIYLNSLKLDDYILSDYAGADGRSVNFYSAYYASQSKGESAHSPRTCLPGGGWLISDLREKTVDGVKVGSMPLKVNRVIIKRGDYVQLVYYWFQERGRILTNEYMVKWYLFWDALTKRRTDGALVRVTTLVGPDENLNDAERRLGEFARQLSGVLGNYIPD